MDATPSTPPVLAAVDILFPAEQTIPFVFASPHSGSDYPADFVRASALDPASLRRSEDIYVDDLFADVIKRGAPLLRARFPRAYCDPNREPYELDPAMFEDELPPFTNTRSPRVAVGLGTIARIVANGADIYTGKLRFAEAEDRIRGLYRPYHQALADLIKMTRRRFGRCILVDCHSMPSVGGPADTDPGFNRVDIVLGDCFGVSCARALVASAERTLGRLGYHVVRNKPYAGGFTTRHYGQPGNGVHAMQIEINRRLYVDETTFAPRPGMQALRQAMGVMLDAMATVPQAELLKL